MTPTKLIILSLLLSPFCFCCVKPNPVNEGGTWYPIFQETFTALSAGTTTEVASWGVFNGGGGDATITNNGPRSPEGSKTFKMRIRDNSSTSYTVSEFQDVAAFSSLELVFPFQTRNTENGQWFDIHYEIASSTSPPTASGWKLLSRFELGTSHIWTADRRWATAKLIIPNGDAAAATEIRFRFTTGFPSNKEKLFVDKVSLYGLVTTEPSSVPSSAPSGTPSSAPSSNPSLRPSSTPSINPLGKPSTSPSDKPSLRPSHLPSTQPSPPLGASSQASHCNTSHQLPDPVQCSNTHRGWGQCPVGLEFQPVSQCTDTIAVETRPRDSPYGDSMYWENIGFGYPVPSGPNECFSTDNIDEFHVYVNGMVRSRNSTTFVTGEHLFVYAGYNYNRVLRTEDQQIYKLNKQRSSVFSWEKDLPFVEWGAGYDLSGHMNTQLEIFDDGRMHICLGDIVLGDPTLHEFNVAVYLNDHGTTSGGIALVPDDRYDKTRSGSLKDITNHPSNDCYCFYPQCL